MTRRPQPDTGFLPNHLKSDYGANRLTAPLCAATIAARRTGPREHGRQAARSKRDRPGRAGEETTQAGYVRVAAGGALDPIEVNSAIHAL
jgi:hypothetical protein